MRWPMSLRRLICFATMPLLLGGCIEILSALDAIEPGATNGAPSSGGGNDGPDGDDSGGVPVASLRVSNPFPQVSETVTLTCSAEGGSSDGLSFDFQPNDGRLDRGRTAGTADFTVSPSDISVEFSYTCTATNVFGTSDRSNAVSIIPTG